MTIPVTEEELDLRGLKCPLPALLAKRAVLRAVPGKVVTAIADDPMARIDIPHMCRGEGFEIVSESAKGDCMRIAIRQTP